MNSVLQRGKAGVGVAVFTSLLFLFPALSTQAAPPAKADRGAGLEQSEQLQGFVTATGEVIGSSQIRMDSGETHQLVKLRNRSRGVVVVDLGVPGAYPAQAVRTGERLVVSGKAGRIDGKPVVFARYVGQMQEVGLSQGGSEGNPAGSARGGTAKQPATPAPTRTDWTQIHASAMLGTKVATPRGERLGWIAGLLLDARPRGQHYAILSVRDESGKEKRFAYPVNAFWRGGEQLILDVPPRNLDIAPGYQNRAWPSPQVRSGGRYVRVNEVIGEPVTDELGGRIGTMEDMVLNLETGRTEYVMVNFDDGAILPVPDHAVRLSTDGAPTVVQPDSQRPS